MPKPSGCQYCWHLIKDHGGCCGGGKILCNTETVKVGSVIHQYSCCQQHDSGYWYELFHKVIDYNEDVGWILELDTDKSYEREWYEEDHFDESRGDMIERYIIEELNIPSGEFPDETIEINLNDIREKYNEPITEYKYRKHKPCTGYIMDKDYCIKTRFLLSDDYFP